MALEIARLLLGLLIAGLHKPIANFITEREHSLVISFRQRGMPLPPALNLATAQNLYFGIGIFIVLVEMLRIYQIAH
jgi:hypothetical protein